MTQENKKSTSPRDRDSEKSEFIATDEARKRQTKPTSQKGDTMVLDQNRKLGKRHD